MQGKPPLEDQAISTPYTEGLKQHETLFGDLDSRLRQWRRVALGLLVTLAVVATDNLYQRLSTKHFVHAVEVLPDGTPVRVVAVERYSPKDAHFRGMVRTFVMDLRERIKEPVVTRRRWDALRAHVTPTGRAKLREEYERDNPFSHKGSVQVNILSVLPLSGKGYQVRWEESFYTDLNAFIETKRYIGNVLVTTRPPATLEEVEANPFGLLVDTWTISNDGM